MRLLILTTETPHHIFFVQNLKKFNPFVISEESMKIQDDFDHEFYQTRYNLERKIWFKNTHPKLEKISKTYYTRNINDKDCIKEIDKFDPDITICFGTRKLNKNLVKKFNNKIFNLHGGNPEEYRGLDSHMWSLYHNDLKGLITCLHLLTEKLDCGPIVAKKQIKIKNIENLEELQIANTYLCINLVKDLLKNYNGKIRFCSQKKEGRYYSRIPSCLIEKCQKNFINLKNK